MIVQISWTLGIIAFSAMALLLYIVFCEIFLGHSGHTEKILGRAIPKEPRVKLFPWLLPIAVGLVLIALYWVLSSFLWNNMVRVPRMGICSLFPADMYFTNIWVWGLCLISLCIYVCGSLLAWRLGGEKWCVLFCLNPWAVLMVLPGQYSLAAFLLVVGYWSVKGKTFWLTGICGAVYLALHFPFTGVDIRELLILAYTALIPWVARCNQKKLSLIMGVMAILCGMVPVILLCMSNL